MNYSVCDVSHLSEESNVTTGSGIRSWLLEVETRDKGQYDGLVQNRIQ
jgi:hypothetical protein